MGKAPYPPVYKHSRKVKELTKLQQKLDKRKISLIEFENKRMEIDRKWQQ